MAEAATATSGEENFAALLDQSFKQGELAEGSVVRGTVIAIEGDSAVIDVGLKCEGRVALREFASPGQDADIVVGTEVDVYLERIETKTGEAALSRDRARREEAWTHLEKAFKTNERVTGQIEGNGVRGRRRRT